MAFKTVGASTFNISGILAGGKLSVVGASIVLSITIAAIHLPVGATAEETFFGQATHSDVWSGQAVQSDAWDAQASFEEII